MNNHAHNNDTMISDAPPRRARVAGGWRPLLACAVLLALLLPLTELAPDVWRRLLTQPSGSLAALLMGAPSMPSPEGVTIFSPGLAVQVTSACSGAGFFVLVLALAAAAIVRRPHHHEALLLLALVPLLYAATLLTNACRIVATWHVSRWAVRVVPDTYHAGLHLFTGAVVFLVSLVTLYILLTRLRPLPLTSQPKK